MKQKLYHILLWITVSVLFSGCYQNIDLDKYKGSDGENLLTINSVLNPDSTIAVVATRTYFYSDPYFGRDYVKDLDISISINGEDKGLLRYDEKSRRYLSQIKPSAGDKIELRTRYLDREVYGSSVVPRAVKIEGVNVTRQGPMTIYGTNSDYILTYEITFSDPADLENYYFLEYTDVKGFGVIMGEKDYTYEYVFQQLANRINSSVPGWNPYSYLGLPFSDYGIDGKTHTLIVKEIIQGTSINFDMVDELQRSIKLYSISKDYYEYMLTLIYNDTSADGIHSGMINLGLSEPVRYFNNINGGIGIFAAYSLNEKIVDVISYTGRFPK